MAKDDYDALVKMKKQGYLMHTRKAKKHIENMAKSIGQAMAKVLAEDSRKDGIVGGMNNTLRMQQNQSNANASSGSESPLLVKSGDKYGCVSI